MTTQKIVVEYKKVLATREKIETVLGMIAPCHVTIGGSYALRHQCDAFWGREIHDYDFIVHGEQKDLQKIKTFVRTALHLLEDTPTYEVENLAFYIGKVGNKKGNVILQEGKYCPSALFESVEDIIAIKKIWAKKSPRPKDLLDIEIFEGWKAENDLPF